MKITISLLGAVLLVSGCANTDGPRELRDYDLRSSENYRYFQTDLYMDLPTVQRQLFINKEHCDVSVEFKKDPMQVHYATVYYGNADATDLKDKIILDLTAYATGKLSIDAFGYYARNHALAQGVLRVLGEASYCPPGVKPKTK